MPVRLPPPANWQDFERLCYTLWKVIWNDPSAQFYGRLGQQQYGVDIFGRPTSQHYCGIQCKCISGALSVNLVAEAAEAALQFQPSLSEFIVATTARRDAGLQAEVRKLSAQYESAGRFSITVWSWDDIVTELTRHQDIIDDFFQYYPNLNPMLSCGFTTHSLRETNRGFEIEFSLSNRLRHHEILVYDLSPTLIYWHEKVLYSLVAPHKLKTTSLRAIRSGNSRNLLGKRVKLTPGEIEVFAVSFQVTYHDDFTAAVSFWVRVSCNGMSPGRPADEILVLDGSHGCVDIARYNQTSVANILAEPEGFTFKPEISVRCPGSWSFISGIECQWIRLFEKCSEFFAMEDYGRSLSSH